MNIEGGLFTDLVVIFAVAAGGGLAARLLRLSVPTYWDSSMIQRASRHLPIWALSYSFLPSG